jgi:hypothetical protein
MNVADYVFIGWLVGILISAVLILFISGFADTGDECIPMLLLAAIWPPVLAIAIFVSVCWLIYKAGEKFGDLIDPERAAYRKKLKREFGDCM